MPIAKFVNGKEIQRIHNERNPECPIGYQMANKIKKQCRELYEYEYGETYLYSNAVIPLSWYERYFGEDTYDPKRKKAIKKDAS